MLLGLFERRCRDRNCRFDDYSWMPFRRSNTLHTQGSSVIRQSYAGTSECKQVKDDLEKPMMDCLMYKHAVEDVLPEKQKILRVVDYEIPKCKTD